MTKWNENRRQENGHYVFIATGRPYAFLSQAILNFGFDGFILANGAHVVVKDEKEKSLQKMAIFMQAMENIIYLVVLALGIMLLLNQDLMNRVLNLMAGGFTTLNGVLGASNTFKKREHRDFWWWFKLALTVIELILGPYFVICCDSVEGGWFIAMGALTMVAGTIEVISALTPESIRSTMNDGKEIVSIIKDK